jgi:alpha-beta hydrolase superfamily lysophospholipase
LVFLVGQHNGTTKAIKGIKENREVGERMVVVKGAGHHVQNDAQAERAAEVFRIFVKGL